MCLYDHYYVLLVQNACEVELGKCSVRLRLHRPGLRQYCAAKRSMSEGGSGSGLAGGGADSAFPHVSSQLRMSEELQSLLSEENETANLDTVHEESEPTSPNGDADAERGSLLAPPGRSDSGNKSNHSLNSPGISFKAKKPSDGSITGL